MSTRREFLVGSAAISALSVADGLPGGDTPTKSNPIMRSYRIPRTDLDVSRIAFGCDRLGRDGVPADAVTADDISQAVRIVNVAHEQGITLFDTADVYGLGQSEALLGHALKESPGLRNRVAIQSKCGVQSGLAYTAILGAVAGSLQRLGTDYLDILLLHSHDPLMEPQEVAKALDELKRSGKVRHFGVSNHTITRIEILKKYVRQPLVVNQIQLGLAHPDLLDEAYFNGAGFQLVGPYTGIAGLDYCRLNDMQVQAYSPLRGKSVFGTAELLGPPTDAPPELKEVARKLHEMAAQKGTTPAPLALAWLLGHPGHILPIIGAKRTEHIVECCAADKVVLSREEWIALFWSAMNPPWYRG